MGPEQLNRIIGLRDTQANIVAFTAVKEEQAIAYATDTGQLGIYTNGAWAWTSGSSGMIISGSGVMTTGAVSDGHLAGFSGSSGNYIYDDEAPQDGNQYARQNAAWSAISASGSGGNSIIATQRSWFL